MSNFTPGITVVIPTIRPRMDSGMLDRALESVRYAGIRLAKEFGLPVKVIVAEDTEKQGAARTRHRGLMGVTTEWTAFLDDDDEMLPNHLVELYNAVRGRDIQYAWSRFRIQFPNGEIQQGPAFLGKKAFSQWDDEDPCQTTVTTLVWTGLAHHVGGFAQFDDTGAEIDGQRRGEDYEFTMRMRKAGANFHHVPQVTWVWHHHGIGEPGVSGNTSGLPERW